VSARIDWNSIETKWIERWEKQKIFESDPDSSREKYFVTVAYPYPNSPQHIGHGRTYTLADTHARYMRMKGYNVLFPMGFHYTGTPILGMSRRVAAGDAELMETFHTIYKLSDDVIATFVEPVKIASYFHHEIKRGMKEMGYSIDWRREFTTIDRVYSKFISWQFRTLRKKGLIVQGSHPVGWCPRDQNPVSQHDTIGDVEPDFNEYTVIKFKSGSGDGNLIILPAATLRPETLFGVTNIWINPEVDYVQAQVDGQKWVISNGAARKLEFLNHKVEIIKTFKGSEMIGWNTSNPLNNTSVPIYPASFVEADSGTGIVMSVPAHAPYDYQALEALKSDEKLQQIFHITVDDKNIRPIKIIESEAYSSGIPAAEAINEQAGAFGQNNNDDYERLEKATSNLYSHEFYKGRMMQNTGRFAGMAVVVAKNEIKQYLLQSGLAETTYEFVNKPVKCRCGAECVVKLLSDQWFLNYKDREWKELAHWCLNNMDIVPQDIRQEFDYVIDWLRERACARKSGLGTKLPWDKEWIVESLSDSVIYMAYYVIAKYVNSKAISDDDNNNITDVFFDYVLLGSGSAAQVAKECNLAAYTVEQIRNEFSYFYPVDSRHSGRDLVPNHLTFFIFNHVAIFDKKNWPRQIVVNGSVLMEGKKMSKSLGNIIPLRAAIREYGADTIRLAMLVSAEILQDADFSFDIVRGIRLKLLGIFEMAEKCRTMAQKATEQHEQQQHQELLMLEDKWLVSRLQRTIAETSASMDRLRIREAIYYTLYSLDRDLQWYLKRAAARKRENITGMLTEFLNLQLRMLAPFAPFTAEEVWELMGNSQSITTAGWPVVEEEKIDIAAEESEFLISSLLEDIQNIVKVTKIIPTKIVIYASAAWKAQVYNAILANILEGRINFGQIMKQLIANPETAKAKSDPKMVQKMIEDILSAPLEARNRRLKLTGFNEVTTIQDAQSLLSDEINKAQIIVYSEEDPTKYDPKSRSKSARPFKPAIYIE
jgi:leucyl-tRNA synthetase